MNVMLVIEIKEDYQMQVIYQIQLIINSCCDHNDNDNIINKDDYEQISNEEIKENTQEKKENINKIKKDLLSISDSFKEQIKIAKMRVKKSKYLRKDKNLSQYLKSNQNKIEYSKNKEELRES